MENDEDTPTLVQKVKKSLWILVPVLIVMLSIEAKNNDTAGKTKNYFNKTTPSLLQAANAEARNDWARYCLKEGGKSNPPRFTPEECIGAAYKLYPEKDWVGIAKNNEVIYQQ